MAEFVCEDVPQPRMPEHVHDAHPERLHRLPTELGALKLVHDQQADAGTGPKLTGQSEKPLFVDLVAVPRRIDPLDAARTEGELDVRRQPDLVGEPKGPREAVAIPARRHLPHVADAFHLGAARAPYLHLPGYHPKALDAQ